jgi:hypothetical protein
MTKVISADHEWLLCPCGDDYAHIKKVSSEISTYNKEDLDVTIEAECEQGHRFQVTLEQKKGNTRVSSHILEPPA